MGAPDSTRCMDPTKKMTDIPIVYQRDPRISDPTSRGVWTSWVFASFGLKVKVKVHQKRTEYQQQEAHKYENSAIWDHEKFKFKLYIPLSNM